MFNVRYIVWRILKRIVISSQRLIQLQKVHLIDCIHTSEFGLCKPLKIYKVGIQWSVYQLKLLNSPQIWMDYLQWHCLQFNHIKRKSKRIKMTRNMHKFENTSIKFQNLNYNNAIRYMYSLNLFVNSIFLWVLKKGIFSLNY